MNIYSPIEHPFLNEKPEYSRSDFILVQNAIQNAIKEIVRFNQTTVEDYAREMMQLRESIKQKKMKRYFEDIIHNVEADPYIKEIIASYPRKGFMEMIFANAFTMGNDDFIDHIEEAIGFGCKKEHIPSYIESHYYIPKKAYQKKLKELQQYKHYYKNIEQEQIEHILKSTHREENKNSQGIVDFTAYVQSKDKKSIEDIYKDKELLYKRTA